jgi:hypothetical protein
MKNGPSFGGKIRGKPAQWSRIGVLYGSPHRQYHTTARMRMGILLRQI